MHKVTEREIAITARGKARREALCCKRLGTRAEENKRRKQLLSPKHRLNFKEFED